MAVVLEEDLGGDAHLELWEELVRLRLEDRSVGQWKSLHRRILAGRPDKAARLAALHEACTSSPALTSTQPSMNVLVMAGSLSLGLVLLALVGLLYWKRRRWRKRGKPSRIVSLLRLQD